MPHPTKNRTANGRALGALLLAAFLTLIAPAMHVSGAPAEQQVAARSALDWLADELNRNGATMPGFTPGSTDWGLTMDTVLAFVTSGEGNAPEAVAATDRIATAEAISAYTTWDPEVPGVRVAGATAKTLLTLRSAGRTSTAGGIDLEQTLRALMIPTGEHRGRFSDQVPDPMWNTANGFAQALAVLALSTTPDGVPAEAADFLTAQQCPAGGFRLNYDSTRSCTSDTGADPDATALAVQALLTVDPSIRPDPAIDRAIAWMLARQLSDGSFGGAGPTSAANGNSTGLAAQTLRATGHIDSADRAADWVTSHLQLDDDLAAGTAAAADAGAIAYSPSARAAALASGITSSGRDQWRRSTSQAVLALGPSPYGQPPAAPTTTTTQPAPTTTQVPTTTTQPAPTTTQLPTTTTQPAPQVEGESVSPHPEPAARPTDSSGVETGRPVSESPPTSLPRTGGMPQLLAALGATCLVAGPLLAAASRRNPSSGRRGR